MLKANMIAQNGYEDLIETGLDECVLDWANEYLRKFTDSEGNCAQKAGLSAVSAIGQGISMYVSFKVSEYLVDAVIKNVGIYWTYINMGKLKNIVKKKMPTKGFFGKAGGFLFKNVLMSDTTGQRIETMKMAQKEVERFDNHNFKYQQQFSSNSQSLEQQKKNAFSVRDNKKIQNIELFRHKTLTSSWNNSTYDKNIFKAVTGQKVTNTGAKSWAKQYKELNQLSTFAKDLEGNLISHSQVLLDNMILQRASKMK
jgi:hypothetical protein